MNWQRNEFGRLVKRIDSEPLSPTASKASSESWSSIALFNTIATLNPLENNPDPNEAIDYLNDLVEKAHTWTRPSIADSTSSEMKGVYEEQCNSLGTYRKPFSPYSDTYNPGWRNHPNFSWNNDANNPTSSNNNHWKPEAPLSQQSYPPLHYNALPPRSSMEGTLQKFETILTQVVEDQKEMKSQITKLTSALFLQE
ncbi:hypothetical protein ACOSP7_028296 [Xanthoceras sorbifolium]